MDVVAALTADGQAPELGQPCQGALDHPPVPTQLLAGLDALAGDPDLGPAAVQRLWRQRWLWVGIGWTRRRDELSLVGLPALRLGELLGGWVRSRRSVSTPGWSGARTA